MKADDADTRLANLEEKVEHLARRANDFALKGQILADVTPSFETGLDRFFGEPEFWENTYDAAQAECSRRCSKDYVEHQAICNDPSQTPPQEQAACLARARDTVIACHAACA
jgi:hypothetical protein